MARTPHTSPVDDGAEDDPDVLFIQTSVVDIRGIELRTRARIEAQKQELRSMVGEQYLDLISAADAIISMNKNAHAVQEKLDSMQAACNVSAIKRQAAKARSDKEEEGQDQQRRHLYALASLIKSLADVPEQIWHALENHRYFHAARLYAIAERVHATDMSFVNVQAAFPVVQRQWDAVSFFLPQIIQKSSAYMRVPDQTSESVAEILLCLMLLDGQTYLGTIDRLLTARKEAIHDVVVSGEHRLAYQLKEIIHIVQRTLIHVYEIYIHSYLLADYVKQLEENFMVGSLNGPAITRVFAPSTNVHLLMRYLPENVQNYTPRLEVGDDLLPDDVKQFAQTWIQNVEELLEDRLEGMLEQVDTHEKLIQARSRVWDILQATESSHRRSGMVLETQPVSWKETCQGLLDKTYSLWDNLFRGPFNNHAKKLVDHACRSLADQPQSVVWKYVRSKSFSLNSLNSTTLPLPGSSAPQIIQSFAKSLAEASQGRQQFIQDAQAAFDDALCIMRTDIEHHFLYSERPSFQSNTDTGMIKEYFQVTCAKAISEYAQGLRKLLDDLRNMRDDKAADDMGILIGRLAHAIGISSKEMPRILTLQKPASHSALELRSGADKDPKYKQLQADFLETFHDGHDAWIESVAKSFARKLSRGLLETRWDDQCPAVNLWSDTGDELQLPIQATNTIELAIYHVCQELQRVNSSLLDKAIVQKLRQQLGQSVINAFLNFNVEISEKGAIQLVFDMQFVNVVLHDGVLSESMRQCINKIKEFIDPINWATLEPHLLPRVERFCLKQSLILGPLTRPTREVYERTRKATPCPNQQHNVLPLAPQAARFTLLPIGHLTTRAGYSCVPPGIAATYSSSFLLSSRRSWSERLSFVLLCLPLERSPPHPSLSR
ncbi:hypothetical protein BX666DRAFT_2109173 [Dichotomocladium elegans]|nr:hypothetical protein BX666DRAFT_2109173 [Dichotomocladium elegans]